MQIIDEGDDGAAADGAGAQSSVDNSGRLYRAGIRLKSAHSRDLV